MATLVHAPATVVQLAMATYTVPTGGSAGGAIRKRKNKKIQTVVTDSLDLVCKSKIL